MDKLYLKVKLIANLMLINMALLMAVGAHAQTTLAPGDIAFTGFDATPSAGSDSFSHIKPSLQILKMHI